MGKNENSPKKKPENHKVHQEAENQPSVTHCVAKGCKAQAKRFDFCNEHYDHFKFGLIKKTGEQALDYEKKFEHYSEYKKRLSVQKAA